MNWLMRKCPRCGRYTLSAFECSVCGSELVVPHPPRFSPEDKYVMYRVKMKRLSGILQLDEKPYHVPG